MYLKLDKKHGEAFTAVGITFKKYDDAIYVLIEHIKQHYDRLEETIRISSLIKFDALVFSADFETIRVVS